MLRSDEAGNNAQPHKFTDGIICNDSMPWCGERLWVMVVILHSISSDERSHQMNYMREGKLVAVNRVGCPGRVSGKFSQVGKEYVSPAKVII